MLTDFLDGFVAKRGWLGGASNLGKILDPVLDKPMIFFPSAAVAVVLWMEGFEILAVHVITSLLLILAREVAVFLMKRSMTKREGLKSAGQHGRASFALQGLGLLTLIASGLALVFANDAPTMMAATTFLGESLGVMVSACYVSGWVYYAQWRATEQRAADVAA